MQVLPNSLRDLGIVLETHTTQSQDHKRLLFIEGPTEELGVLEFLVRESGGFEGIEVEQIATGEKVVKIFERAESHSTDSVAPNQDGIYPTKSCQRHPWHRFRG